MSETVGDCAKELPLYLRRDHVIYPHDPVPLALGASMRCRTAQDPYLPEPFCADAGRRLLLAVWEFSDWVLRRVEKVQFDRDRSVTRHNTVEFLIRPDAPVFMSSDGIPHYLVPLSMLRRRTLVDFKIEDEDGRRIPMLGMRIAQQLDQSMLMAAAASTSLQAAQDPKVKHFVQEVVAGTAETVEERMNEFDTSTPEHLKHLASGTLFSTVLERLARSFTLYVLLPVDKGTHRVLSLTFDEPAEWSLQQPTWSDLQNGHRQYRAGRRVSPPLRFLLHMSAKLGLKPTRIRFQVPSAENTASYHFEAAAPPGVRIVQASLLAGRPHEPRHQVSIDRVVGHAPTVGLHAVEVPNGSLCRVQLDLRVPARGWLTQLVMSCVVIMLVLGSVAVYWPATMPGWTDNQVTNVVVLLVTASAATATLVAQRDFHGVAAALVTHLRAVGVLSLSVPIVAAGYLVYRGAPSISATAAAQHATVIWWLFALTVLLFLIPATALLLSWLAERNSKMEASPWDMTVRKAERKADKGGTAVHKRSSVTKDFNQATAELGFNSPAVGIQSAESWHENYSWTDDRQREATSRLRQLKSVFARSMVADSCRSSSPTCTAPQDCSLHAALAPRPPVRKGQSTPDEVQLRR